MTNSITQSISHKLLDKALEIMGKDPSDWTHADDLFMLSIYGGRNKGRVMRAFMSAQAQENHYGKRLGDKTPGERSDLDAFRLQLATMRPVLAAGVDWRMLLSPLKTTNREWGARWRDLGLWFRGKNDYFAPPDVDARER